MTGSGFNTGGRAAVAPQQGEKCSSTCRVLAPPWSCSPAAASSASNSSACRSWLCVQEGSCASSCISPTAAVTGCSTSHSAKSPNTNTRRRGNQRWGRKRLMDEQGPGQQRGKHYYFNLHRPETRRIGKKCDRKVPA